MKEENIPPFLETERLFLKKVTEEHCNSTYLRWMMDHEVNKYLESGLFPQTIESLKTFVQSLGTHTLFLAIHKKKDNKHIGNIKIDQFHPFHNRAEYGILMGEKDEWGKGYAKEATIAIINHCFNRMNLHKLTLGVVEANVGALKLYEKLGFTQEGKLIAHSFHEGAYQNVIRMAIFQDQWLNS